MSSDVPVSPLLKTPLTDRHVALGAKMVPFAGYSMPIQYAGLTKEHQAVRTAAGLFDVCHMGEIRITGPQTVAFVQHLVTNDLDRITVGQAMYSCACRTGGGIVDDLIVYKHGENEVLIVCNASNRAKFAVHLEEQRTGFPDLEIVDESEQTALLALQGPAALGILGRAEPKLASLASTLRPFRFTKASLCQAEVTVARTGYTGEDGVEIFAPANAARAIWDALLEAGQDADLLPAGLGCRDTLRLEARLSLYGNELDEETNPLEAGLAWTVKLDKPDFLGKGALLLAKEKGLQKQLVGFEVLGRGSARSGYPLLDSAGAAVGVCTSGGPSPTLGKAIGLGYLPPSMTALGTSFQVDARGRPLPAVVVKTPFYRRA